MDRFRCRNCTEIGDIVLVCDREHIVCAKCVENASIQPAVCKCELVLHSRQPNPIKSTLVVNHCKYYGDGCQWEFSTAEYDDHLKECRYRPYKCIGAILNVWNCEWAGKQIDLDQHFRDHHSDLGAMFTQNTISWVPFDETKTMGTLNLVDAFNRRFVFYYHTSVAKEMVYFCIFLLGKRSQASLFYVEFEINNSSSKFERVEFQTYCASDVDDILKMVADEQFVALSHRSLKKYLDLDNQIRFRFMLKPKKTTESQKMASDSIVAAALKEPMKSDKTSVATAKGKTAMVPNTKKAAHTIPSAMSKTYEPLASRVPAVKAAVLEATNIIPTMVTAPPKAKPSLFVSINNQQPTDAQTSPPCLSSASAQTPGCKNTTPTFRPQPYKGVDEKFYTVKYPSSSIHKPKYRK